MSKEEIFAIIDDELEKRKEHTFLLWDFPNDVKKRIEELYQSVDNANPSKALRKLDDISYLVLNEIEDLKNKELWKSYFNTIKQALIKAQELEKENAELKRVLEIIKEKNVDFYNLKTCINLEHYNSEIRLKNQNNTYSYEIWYELTQEEFDLLKRYFEKH